MEGCRKRLNETGGCILSSLFLLLLLPFPVEPQHRFVVYRMELGLGPELEETAGAEGSELKTRMGGHDTGQNGTTAGLS